MSLSRSEDFGACRQLHDFGRASRIFLWLLLIIGLVLAGADPGFADQLNGGWLSPELDNWPLVSVHAALTPDGRVLTFGSNSGGKATGFFIYDVWDPTAGLSGGHVTLPNPTGTDIFCGNAVILPDSGDILISGGAAWNGTDVSDAGNNRSTIYNAGTAALTGAADMNRARWYATALPLMDDEVYVQGGKNGEDFPEVLDRDGQYRLLTNVATSEYSFYYPRNFIAPDGRVFGFDIQGRMYFVTTDGTGSISPAGQLDSDSVGKTSTVAMYRPGKILVVSGMNNHALTIDINGAAPVVASTGSLSSRRAWSTATVLPNGKVLVTGGSGQPNQLVDVNNSAEIWDPDTDAWTVGASGSRPRLYHSFALLLPDASVLVGGGGANLDPPLNNLHSEIYYPPYLYDSSGEFAARPAIGSTPGPLHAGEEFSLATDSPDIERVTLVRAGSATHGANPQQRFIELSFTRSNNTLLIKLPSQATTTPPGYYLLFLINAAGVPSYAKIVKVVLPAEPDTISPAQTTGLVATKVQGNPKLTWNASNDNTGVVGYAIHRSTNGRLGSEFVRIQGTTWIDSAVQEGTKYTYAVQAFDASGNLSPASANKSVIAFQIPTKPTNFTITLINRKPQLHFVASMDNVGVVGYNVYRSTDGTLGPLLVQIAGPSWIDGGAQAGVRYTYAVRARDAAGYLSYPTPLRSISADLALLSCIPGRLPIARPDVCLEPARLSAH